MATTYVPLATTTATGGETTISFTSISGSYTDLVLVSSLIATTPYEMFLQFNTDTGTNYSTIYMEGNGTAASSGKSTTSPNILVSYNSTSNPTTVTINIQNYANTVTNKTVLARSSAASASVLSYVGMWRNTAAITSIQLKLTGGRSFSAGATFSLYGIANAAIAGGPKATGGDIVTTDGTYWYHAFRASGTFTPSSTLSCDVLVIAGGGGGGADRAGGGGAGGYRSATSLSFSSAQTVTVGAGGAGAPGPAAANGSKGSNSVISTITSTGGGFGAGVATGGAGGSGGGAFGQNNYLGGAGNEGAFSPVEGYAGGNSLQSGNIFSSGGGGGAGAVGGNAVSNASPGAGGIGSNAHSTWASATGTGVSGYYAGGGGGAGDSSPSSPINGGAGGTGGGGSGGATNTVGTSGTANTGGGGGGGGNISAKGGGNGGSGLVIVRYAV
jgi:hypothetical protein